MRLFAFTTALLTACLFSNTASALTYNCEVEPSREGAWIGSQLIIRHNETTGEVTVLDNLIKHYIGDAIAAEIETENSKRITFIWKLENFGSSATDDLQFTSGFFLGRPSESPITKFRFRQSR